MNSPSVLLVDDEPQILTILSGFLKEENWDVFLANNGQEALQMLLAHRIDVAVVDLRMPGLSGFDVLEQAYYQGVTTHVFILTAFGSVPDAVKAMQLGAVDYILKPVQKDLFIEKIKSQIEKRITSIHVLTERMVAYVTAQSIDSELTMTKLLSKFHISKSYACKLFGELGTSFTEVLTHARIDRAKQLMVDTEEPLYVIAGMCGFKNAQRLSEAFNRHEGCSPSKFRQLGGHDRIK